MKQILFKETQRFTILIVGAFVASVLFAVLSVVNIGFHQSLAYHSKPDLALSASAIGCFIIALLINSQKLVFIVYEDEIHISFGILTGKQVISIDNIKNISVRK